MRHDILHMKPERLNFGDLTGWVKVTEASKTRSGERVETGAWTAYQMADHLEACELVGQIGVVADWCCVTPDIGIRRNFVFVTVRTESGMTQEDLEFAQAVDFEVGIGLKARALLGKPETTVWEPPESVNEETLAGGEHHG